MEKQVFIDNMAELMRQISELCKHVENAKTCAECPFDKYCDALLEAGFDMPDWEWRNM